MVLESGDVYTGYYGECSPEDLARMAYHFHTDSIWQLLTVNAGALLKMAEEQETGEEEESNG